MAINISQNSVKYKNSNNDWVGLNNVLDGVKELPTVTAGDDGKVLKVINGNWELGEVEVSGGGVSADHKHSFLSGWSDTRNDTTKPDDYNGKFKITGLKVPEAIGSPDDSRYHSLIGFRGWSDSSGGNAHELAFTGNGRIYHRNGVDVDWTAWRQILDSENYVNYKHKSINAYGNNTITSTTDDTTTNWGKHGISAHFYTATGQLIDQPAQWGFLLNIGSAKEVVQLWKSAPNGELYHRGGNANGWSGTWRKILDSSNYSSYALPLSGGTLTTSGLYTPLILQTDTKEASITYKGTTSSNWTVGLNAGQNTTESRFGWYNSSGGGVAYIEPNGNFRTAGTIYEGWTALSEKYAPKSHNHAASNITSGTLGVARGGTGATTFTSGAALIGAGTGAVTTRAITNMTSKSYINYNTNLMTTNTLAHWNGAFNASNSSNLTYCNRGAFGTIVTKATTDYLSSTGGAVNGRIHSLKGTYTSTASNRFGNSALEIRENGHVGTAQTDIGYAPSIGFHWSGRCAGTLILDSSGRFQFLNQAGSNAQVWGSFFGANQFECVTTGTTEAQYIAHNGGISGMFCASASYKIGIYNNTTASWVIYSDSSGTVTIPKALAVEQLFVGTYASSFGGNLSVSGDIYANGANGNPLGSSYAINARIGDDGRLRKVNSSSIRYKNHISDLTYEDIEPLYTIPTHWFKYKPEYIEQEDIRFDTPIPGYYVEDWMDVMPIAIDLNKDGLPEMWNQNIVIPLTFEMVKGNHNRINDHAKEIDILKAENNDLKARIEKLEKIIEGLCA